MLRTMADQNGHFGTIAGTIGGTLTSFIASVDMGDLVRTSILAVVGAVVSFTVSVLLKWLVRSRRKRYPE